MLLSPNLRSIFIQVEGEEEPQELEIAVKKLQVVRNTESVLF